MTATPILEALAGEFSIQTEEVQSVLEMIDAGLSGPFVGRFRRATTGALSESMVRRLTTRRLELEELDRRRGTILRTLERDDTLGADVLDPIKHCMDRFELEDLFVPHRRPEPEVQLAIDRGLGALADLLVKPVPRLERQSTTSKSEPDPETEVQAEPTPTEVAEQPAEAAPVTTESEGVSSEPVQAEPVQAEPVQAEPVPVETNSGDSPTAAETSAEVASAEASDAPPESSVAPPDSTEPPASAETPPSPAESVSTAAKPEPSAPPTGPVTDVAGIAGVPVKVAITPELARLCAPFVAPDKGVHTEAEALAGAVRILSDRLGRNSHLRGLVRRMLKKRGTLKVRPLVDPSKAGRHKPLLKIKQNLSQLQGHRLLAIRQAQKERVLSTSIELDPSVAAPKVRAVLGKHTHPEFGPLLDEIARKTLEVRLLPVVEADVRLMLKERGDAEALRFLSQHLRQILLTPVFGPYPAAGIDVSAKGDWTVALVGEDGVPTSFTKIERGEKDAAALGAELAACLGSGTKAVAVGHGKGPRAAVSMLRESLKAAGLGVVVTIVNEAGLSSYASSDLARKELPDQSIQERAATSLARRLQDPMAEVLKVDPRHLGLGPEQGLVSKANARRAFNEIIESCTAHVGCDLNRAPFSVLRNLPGLDADIARKIIERRAESPFRSREQLQTEGVLTPAQWTSAIAFLRIPDSEEFLDRTGLHPEMYDLVRRLFESTGGSVEESLGRPAASKGLRRTNFGIDSSTWRDLMREITYPGRDPRMPLRRPELLAPDTDSVRLLPDRVVEGIVTNVASFGVFVDIGLPQDAMIHISEISNRYLRDARELLSIGEVVRARILGVSGSRLALSLNNVPAPEAAPRKPRQGGREGGRQGGREGRRGRKREDDRPRENPHLRAAQSRRDGPGAKSGGRGRGPGRGGPRKGGRDRDDGRIGQDERKNLEKMNAATKGAAFNPFADFFKKKEPEVPDSQE